MRAAAAGPVANRSGPRLGRLCGTLMTTHVQLLLESGRKTEAIDLARQAVAERRRVATGDRRYESQRKRLWMLGVLAYLYESDPGREREACSTYRDHPTPTAVSRTDAMSKNALLAAGLWLAIAAGPAGAGPASADAADAANAPPARTTGAQAAAAAPPDAQTATGPGIEPTAKSINEKGVRGASAKSISEQGVKGASGKSISEKGLKHASANNAGENAVVEPAGKSISRKGVAASHSR